MKTRMADIGGGTRLSVLQKVCVLHIFVRFAHSILCSHSPHLHGNFGALLPTYKPGAMSEFTLVSLKVISKLSDPWPEATLVEVARVIANITVDVTTHTDLKLMKVQQGSGSIDESWQVEMHAMPRDAMTCDV